MFAAMKGDVERVRWLLARGALTELKDSLGRTALWWAVLRNRADVMRVLIAAGTDEEAVDLLLGRPSMLGQLKRNSASPKENNLSVRLK